jgi:hypothetical protein
LVNKDLWRKTGRFRRKAIEDGLAPDLQEAILFLPRTERGRDPIPLWRLLPIASTVDWKKQRTLWATLMRWASA